VIAEIGFMSNPEELAKLKDRNFQERAAASIKYGILEALAKI
jgi:N-acetylmuramoyl-L-alanine amidase